MFNDDRVWGPVFPGKTHYLRETVMVEMTLQYGHGVWLTRLSFSSTFMLWVTVGVHMVIPLILKTKARQSKSIECRKEQHFVFKLILIAVWQVHSQSISATWFLPASNNYVAVFGPYLYVIWITLVFSDRKGIAQYLYFFSCRNVGHAFGD